MKKIVTMMMLCMSLVLSMASCGKGNETTNTGTSNNTPNTTQQVTTAASGKPCGCGQTAPCNGGCAPSSCSNPDEECETGDTTTEGEAGEVGETEEVTLVGITPEELLTQRDIAKFSEMHEGQTNVYYYIGTKDGGDSLYYWVNAVSENGNELFAMPIDKTTIITNDTNKPHIEEVTYEQQYSDDSVETIERFKLLLPTGSNIA